MSDRVLLADAIVVRRGEVVLRHYGMPRRSGRYPWGSGENPYQHTPGFRAATDKAIRDILKDRYPDGVPTGKGRLSAIKKAQEDVAKGYGMSIYEYRYYTYDDLRKSGKSDSECAEAMGMTIGEFRSWKTIDGAQQRVTDIAECWALKNKGYSQRAIAEKLGITEGTVRNYLKSGADLKARETLDLIDSLRKRVDEAQYIDVGGGNELFLDTSKTKMDACLDALKNEGYNIFYQQAIQPTTGLPTTVRVLTKEDYKTFKDAFEKDQSIVKGIGLYKDSVTDEIEEIKPPVSIDSSRIFIRYGDQGGTDKDGLIELRSGVQDLDLTDSKYAQVRIAVDGTHYMKGMAIRADDAIPEGYDVVYNTNKASGTPASKVFKKMKDDPEHPFGASIEYQKTWVDADGVEHTSALNIVNDEGTWNNWSKSLASQFLSKQPVALAKKQLGLVQESKEDELNEILALTNPTVRRKLLQEYADSCDSSAEHLKAAALPRQKTQVIIPVPELKDNEIYCEQFRDGEKVVLVRYPHGGPFESPELIVNNKNKAAKKLLGGGLDCVGINARVAERLSGADFDGDNVIVIPNNDGKVITKNKLALLDGFDPKVSYKIPHASEIEDMYNAGKKPQEIAKELGVDLKAVQQIAKSEKRRDKVKNAEMGKVSNLITDMTIKGANDEEIARAVAHSMVVIDSVKHNLDYKASYDYFGIKELQNTYQDGGGASTIVSRASGQARVDEYKIAYSKKNLTPEQQEAWDRGEEVRLPTGRSYQKSVHITDPSKMTADERALYDAGKEVWRKTDKVVSATVKTSGMRSVQDARELSSGTAIEEVYANHANGLKALGNKARAEMRTTPTLKQSPSAAKTYAEEVESLKAKVRVSEMNRPLERQAVYITNAKVSQALEENPGMSSDALKKLRNSTMKRVRDQLGSSKSSKRVEITDREWEAIQAGAVSDNLLQKILNNTDMDRVRQLSTPRGKPTLSSAQITRIQSMYDRGMTQADIADAIGVSTSTITRVIVGDIGEDSDI